MNGCTNEELGRLMTRYEAGQLSDEERDRFEEHLLDCDFCFQELKQMAPFMSAIQRHRVALIDSLHRDGISFESLKEDLLASHHTKRIPYRKRWESIAQIFENLLRPRVWGPAIGVVAVVVLFLLITPFSGNPYLDHLSVEKLSFNELHGYEATHLRGGNVSEADSLFLLGMDDYLANNYKGAIGKIEDALEIAPDKGNWWLYLGVCYYLDHKANPAIEALTMADSLTQFYNKERARWYLAQAYLLKKDSQKAVPLLEWIVAQNRIYAEKADTLLKAVQSIDRGTRKK
jgi:hypothetical protein